MWVKPNASLQVDTAHAGQEPCRSCIVSASPCKNDSHACSPAPWRRSGQLSLKQADGSSALASMHRPLSAAQSGCKKLMAGELEHGVTPTRADLKKYCKCCCNLTCGRVHTQLGLMRSGGGSHMHDLRVTLRNSHGAGAQSSSYPMHGGRRHFHHIFDFGQPHAGAKSCCGAVYSHMQAYKCVVGLQPYMSGNSLVSGAQTLLLLLKYDTPVCVCAMNCRGEGPRLGAHLCRNFHAGARSYTC